jgi:phosphoribosylglycinamide formyltransferase-1
MMKLAVFLSGKGSNFLSILNAIDAGRLVADPVLVISNTSTAGGLQIAEARGIGTRVFDRARYESGEQFATDMLTALKNADANFIALAGYLRKIPPPVIRAYANRILNIHPALLPKFGGKGMFGEHVHQAVLDAGETESGVTIHLVSELYDEGEIVAQRRVKVYPDDDVHSLAARVLAVEHELYPEVLAQFAARM